ncbi:MAG TPA: hypothetical protein VJ894_06720, partial [Cryomorphaceae bacterium]|nr:hypothetical protein [Cryomorphaceae bacterium]
MNLIQAQQFEEFYSIPKSELKATLSAAAVLCDLNSGKWLNAAMPNMAKDHLGKLTVVHFGTFD